MRNLGNLLLALLSVGMLLAADAGAATVAYWRFEGDGVLTPADGDWVTPTAGRTTIEVDADPANPPKFIVGYDSTGNGNNLYTWDDNATGHQYRASVSNSTVGAASNNFSIQNNGGFPATYTWSQQSHPTGTDLQTIAPSQWTIEATIKPTTVDGGFRTFVGREGNGVSTTDANGAPLYFQITNNNQFRINYTDAAGNVHIADSPDTVLAHQWYHVAAVSNGSTVKLYVDSFNGQGYQEKASLDLTTSTNSAMINPGVDANGDTWGWTLGRGRYGSSDDPNADHTDRFFGYIDEVRISDSAVAPASLLFAGQAQNSGPMLTINRATGEMNLTNMQSPINIVSYHITSASGALTPENWFSISGNQDSDSGGGFDPNDAWNVLTATRQELSEVEPDGDGGSLGTVKLGKNNAWTASRFEDVAMTIEELLPDFSTRSFNIPVQYVGGLGKQAARSDLDLDGDVDGTDWGLFTASHLATMTTLTAAQSAKLGDLDGDLDNDFTDFRLFQADFDGANGVGAFAAMIAAVPEPSTLLTGLMGVLALTLKRRSTK
jgi:hypothetical protein